MEQKRRIVAELETSLTSLSSTLVQVTGEGKNAATAGKETSFDLSLSFPATPSTPFPIKQLCCQLTDPHHQHIHCSITSTQPGVCSVTYTPTLRGPHQLRITICDNDIPGSPFTVYVLSSSFDMVKHTIIGFNNPWGVAVSKNGEVVVSELSGHCISVYSREGKKIRSFGILGSGRRQFHSPRNVAITSDNRILVADSENYRIQMLTIEGRFLKFVGCKGEEPLEFNQPSGIAVHPSGRVFVADTDNHRIQVLNRDLSFSHMFGSQGSAPGQFNHPRDVAIDNSGVVYVTDYLNNCVKLFSAAGQFMSTFSSFRLQHPTSICVDSTNIAYVTDDNNHVSVYTSSGQLIKCFDSQGNGEGELNGPEGVAIDNTTGTLYVCDTLNNRVVVY